MSAGSLIPCQWIEVDFVSLFVTAIVTFSPSVHLNVGPGTEPLIAVATERCPVKLTCRESMVRSKCIPLRTGGLCGATLANNTDIPLKLYAVIAAPAKAPCTKRRRLTGAGGLSRWSARLLKVSPVFWVAGWLPPRCCSKLRSNEGVAQLLRGAAIVKNRKHSSAHSM